MHRTVGQLLGSGGNLHVVGGAAVLGLVEAGSLLLGGGAEEAHRAECHEEGTEEGAGPGDDDEDADDLATEEFAFTAVEDTVIERLRGVSLADVLLGGEEANEDHTPHTAHAVHGESFEGIIDAELEEELAGGKDDNSTNRASEDGSPGLDDGATGGDRNETGEASVAHGDEVPDMVQAVVDDHGGDATGGGGDGGGDGGAGDDSLGGFADNGKHGPGVEAVPSHPQDEGTENDEGSVVTGHGDGAAIRTEAAGTGTDNHGTHKTSETTNHVHNTGAGKVNHTNTVELVTGAGTVHLEGGEPSVAVPHPVSHSGVHECGEEEGVAEVSLERGTLGDGTRDDGGGGGGEGPLEKEGVPVGEALVLSTPGEGEVTSANEGAGLTVLVGTVSDAVPGIEDEGGEIEIERGERASACTR